MGRPVVALLLFSACSEGSDATDAHTDLPPDRGANPPGDVCERIDDPKYFERWSAMRPSRAS